MIPAISGRMASQPAMRLKAAQNGVIVEGTALYDDMSAKLGRIGDLDYLIQCIFDDGIGKSGRDIGDGQRPPSAPALPWSS